MAIDVNVADNLETKGTFMIRWSEPKSPDPDGPHLAPLAKWIEEKYRIAGARVRRVLASAVRGPMEDRLPPLRPLARFTSRRRPTRT